MLLGARRVSWAIVAVALATGIGTDVATAASLPIRAEVDLLELRIGPGNRHLALESTVTAGADLHQFALKVDGGSDARVAFDWLQFQALWMPQVSSGATLAVGLRRDESKGRDLTYAAAGAELDLAPWLAGEHYFYLSRHGDLTGGAKLSARWPLTKRLTLEPRVQLGWSAQEIPAEKLSAGLTDMQASIRLRRAMCGNADLYVGVLHRRLIGGTYSIARSAGDAVAGTTAVIGMGLSF